MAAVALYNQPAGFGQSVHSEPFLAYLWSSTSPRSSGRPPINAVLGDNRALIAAPRTHFLHQTTFSLNPGSSSWLILLR